MKKLIDFKHLADKIQTHADENFEGNFSLAVRSLIAKALMELKK